MQWRRENQVAVLALGGGGVPVEAVLPDLRGLSPVDAKGELARISVIAWVPRYHGPRRRRPGVVTLQMPGPGDDYSTHGDMIVLLVVGGPDPSRQ